MLYRCRAYQAIPYDRPGFLRVDTVPAARATRVFCLMSLADVQVLIWITVNFRAEAGHY